MGRMQRSDRGKMMEKLTLSQRREERSAAKPQPKRIRDGGSKRRSCSLGNVRSEEKRQRTAALQNLAEASCCVARASVLECGCPLPLSLEPLSADRTLQSHPVGYDKSFEKSSQPASNLGVLQCGARSAWLSRAAPALKPQIRSQRQGGLELGASLELGAWCLELWPYGTCSR